MNKNIIGDIAYVCFMGICAWLGVLVTEWFITVPNWQTWYIASGVVAAIFVRCLNRHFTNKQEKNLKAISDMIQKAHPSAGIQIPTKHEYNINEAIAKIDEVLGKKPQI